MSPFLAASTLAAVALSLADLVTWPSARRPDALVAMIVLALVNGAATGLCFLAVFWLPTRAASGAGTKWRIIVPAALMTTLSLLAGAQAVMLLRAGSYTVLLSLAAGCVVLATVLTLGIDACLRERARRRAVRVATLAVVALAGIVLDRTAFAVIVEARYSFVEASAHVALVLAFAHFLGSAPRASKAVSLASLGALALLASSPSLRLRIERALPVRGERAAYATRVVRRVRLLESLATPQQDRERLAEKYGLTSAVGIDEAWQPRDRHVTPTSPAARPASPYNIVVFFVDTLRADVAQDDAVMPETVAWAKRAHSFTRGYSSGSSTLLTLAPMLGCRYDTLPSDRQRPRLLDAAKAAGVKTGLVIARSAFDYHRGAFPGFQFEDETIVTDIHGRRLPTAAKIVERSLDWLRAERPERFLLWVYHYDVHSWNDLDGAYVERHAAEGGFSKTEGKHWRYRAAARGVDAAFTRLRAGLEELGHADDTIVVFVSDHGEALGEQNFWAHSTFLWESLIRVPMAFYVPGREGRTTDVPVSTVDVATTLVHAMGQGDRTADCHGVNLLGAGHDRPLPILFSAMTDGHLARIGMLGGHDRKLVFDLRDVDARWLRITDGDEEDVSQVEPQLLSMRLGQLVRAPIFPRGR